MFENPGDELYFGEVYRQVLQEAWLPEGADVWSRLGKSRRGRRPTQRGIYAHSLTHEQAVIRLCFSKCVSAWNALPWDNPKDPGCDDRWGKEYWKKEKDDRGVPCSYYDLFMRYCLRYCIDTGCVMPSAYSLNCGPPLTQIKCFDEYNLPITGQCGTVSLTAGPGDFSPPNTWTAPLCGEEDVLYFKDANGATGCLPITFDPSYYCRDFIWPAWNPDEISRNTEKSIYVATGFPPYHWFVAGIGFSLANSHTETDTNKLIADDEACGSAIILVKDSCHQETGGDVRCEDGQWVFKGNYCGLSGSGILVSNGGRTPTYELIVGRKKQLQTSYCPVVFGSCWEKCGAISCGMGITLDEFCSDMRDQYCTFAPRCDNCIDPDVSHRPFCTCVGSPAHPHRTWCVGDLEYYMWEC